MVSQDYLDRPSIPFDEVTGHRIRAANDNGKRLLFRGQFFKKPADSGINLQFPLSGLGHAIKGI